MVKSNGKTDSSSGKQRKSSRKERSDKGVKRSEYNLGLRKHRQDARQLQLQLDDIDRFEKLETVDEELKKSRGERKKDKRLSLIPDPRICPFCSKVKLKSKQWAITESFIGCKSCFWKLMLLNKGIKT